jgi:HK97 family phage major capsid protein
MSTQLETRLQNRIERREMVQGQHEELLRERGDGDLSEADKKQIEVWRGAIADLDSEIEQLTDDVEAHKKAAERSKALVRARLDSVSGVDMDGDGVVYRDFASFARDKILTRDGEKFAAIQQRLPKQELEAARTRLELLRTPANTLSSNVAGLIPDQHIAQIMQVIDNSRPIVASARRASLDRGRLSFPKVTQRPVVAVQATEKTEAGNTGMLVGMEEATASTYLGGGDLSWQAINWSTPDALQLWFDLAAADYALKTETDAATVVSAAAFLNNISSTLAATPTFAQLMTAIAAGGGDVYANSGRMADTVYMAPDRYWYALGLTSDSSLSFGQSGLLNVNGESRNLNVVVSRGLNAGEIIVGDSDALLVAETPGAPVELRAVEPAIGGVEVGIIGAFEAVVVEDEAFALITTAS